MRRVDYVIQDVEFEMENAKFSLFERSKLPGLIGREGGNPPHGEIGFLR